MDIISYILSRKYTDNSILGISGALAGKNCTIESATKTDGITTIVFKWTADNDEVRRTSIQVADGETPNIQSSIIAGGHRVTFTTVDPAQTITFDVMDGADGVSVVDAEIRDSDQHLIITLSDNNKIDCGEVKGAQVLSDLEDIALTSVQDGDILRYNETTQKWENQELNIAVNIEDLDNVLVNNLQNGQILVYDAVNHIWKNSSPSATSTSLDDLSNVNIDSVTLANGQTLVYDAENNVWTNGESSDDYVTHTELNADYLKMGLIDSIDDVPYTLVNVMDYGALGDGTTDDSGAFLSALSASTDGIWIPKGSYNLNHEAINLSSLKVFVGESKDFVTLIDANITAPYGITCKNITFDGGTTGTDRNMPHGDGTIYSGLKENLFDSEITINVTPFVDLNSQTSIKSNVCYENCIFTNMGVASLAYQFGDISNTVTAPRSGYVSIENDIVKNCVFKNITASGIYHMCNILHGTYENNTFTNIGRTSSVTDNIVALKSGDTSNQSDRGVIECLVNNNIFEDIISYNDLEADVHSGETNMVTIQGDNIIVTNNVFKNLRGFGHDREGLYLKAHYADISNNYFENAGLGEGYICCKNREKIPNRDSFYTDANVDIHDNVLVGSYGCGMKLYYTATVHNNNIDISVAAKNLIHAGKNVSPYCNINIYDNDMKCGMSYPVVINGVTINNFYDDISNDKIVISPIRIYNHDDVYISRNNITLNNNIEASMIATNKKARIIGIQTFLNNAIIKENTFNAISASSIYGIILSTTNSKSNNIYVDVENNTNDTYNSLLKVTMKDADNTSMYTNIAKQFVVKNNNIIRHSTNMYDVEISVNSDNSDTLEFNTHNNVTIGSGNNYVHTNVNYIDIPDETWVVPI